jgi:hypothetical protein
MLDKDIAELMGIVPNDFNEPVIRGGAFDDVKDQTSPFGFQKCEGKTPHVMCPRHWVWVPGYV